jgi:hypothetical protein
VERGDYHSVKPRMSARTILHLIVTVVVVLAVVAYAIEMWRARRK